MVTPAPQERLASQRRLRADAAATRALLLSAAERLFAATDGR
ncbi:hypothetical protein [Micromonospora rubida]|nr:hypothetical protein [Micromonospora rubida]